MTRPALDLGSRIWSNPFGRTFVILAAFALLYGFFRLTLPIWEGVFAFVRLTLPVWSSFLLALLIAYLLDPLLAWLEEHGMHRAGAIVVVAAALLGFVGLLWFLAVTLVAQLTDMVLDLPGLVDGARELPFRLARLVDPTYGTVFQEVFTSAQAWIDRFVDGFLPSLETADSSAVTERIVGVLGGGLQVAMTLALTIFFLYRFRVYAHSFLLVVPERHRDGVREVAVELGQAVGGYIRGQLLIALAVGVLSWIGLMAIGIPLALPLGVLAGALNLVPFFGPVLVAIPTALIALTLGWPHTVGALGILVLVNQIDAHVLTPIVFSHTVEIDPATIILAIFLGTVLFGLLGAILAVPAAVMLRFFYRRNYLGSAWYRGTRRRSARKGSDIEVR